MSIDWPALLTGLIAGAYWGRVIKLVLKTRRLTGKAGNFWPAEPIGRALRLIWYPLVVVWITVPLVRGLFSPSAALLQPVYAIPVLQYASVLIVLVAFGLTLVCWKRMGKSWRMGIDPGEKTQLVLSGPYAYVRHPIYALQALIIAASAVAVPVPLMIAAAFLLIGLLVWEARREEQYLLRVHGEAYARYLGMVGGFIPRSLSPARTV
jgi:protein-S-isoprenylcysteine O-methyltransferase Ste14